MIRPSTVPASPGVVISGNDCPTSPADIEEMKRLPFSEYRSLVGSMLYFAVTSRPDISFAVCQLSRVMSNPSKAHWNELLVLLRYLSGTRSKGIVYRRDGPTSSSSSDLQEERASEG